MPYYPPASGSSVSAASQAEQETGTSTTTYVSPGRQQFHDSADKAWVRIDGTGTVTVISSYNISSVDDDGVGLYGVNFDVNFSGTDYTMIAVQDPDLTVHTNAPPGTNIRAIAAGACDFQTNNVAGVAIDVDLLCIVFKGDQ